MNKYIFIILSLFFTACSRDVVDIKYSEKIDPNPLRVPDNLIPADFIASAGHGEIFDYKGNPIEITDDLVVTMQSSMIKELWKFSVEKRDKSTLQLNQVMKYISTEKIATADKALLQSGVVAQLLRQAPLSIRDRYDWRHRLLLPRAREYYLERQDFFPRRFLELIRILDLAKILDGLVLPTTTDYVERCKSENVPVPPPWSEESSSWKYHGTLSEKLILPNIDAHVWTWADPHQRGGCIALPRGSGAVGSAAGIICQSATTGKACFWDNIRRTETTVFGWKNLTLNVNELKDGDTLNGCTGCHQGNNVFNISPDDTTWQKVINPARQSNVGTMFTTHIENNAIPRYIPISTQASWTNPEAAECIGCHERPNVGFSPPRIMPPNCKSSNADPSGCYSP